MQPFMRLVGTRASEVSAASGIDVRIGSMRGASLYGIVAAAIVGFLLRIVMAQGDLWLDEAWSLKLVAGISSPWAVFWEISHDNNHFLNSFWLSWLGPEAPPWAYRMPSVVFGTLAIPLAAGIGWRRSRAGAVVAAWFVALSMPLVIYGSEARGYAGLVASSLVAIAAFEPALENAMTGRLPGRAAWGLGIAIGFGTLCHLTMLATLAVLGMAATLPLRTAGPRSRTCLGHTMTLFGPSLVCLLPAVAAVMAGFFYRGTFECGGVVLFTGSNFAAGFGGMLRAVLGLWDGLPTGIVFLGAALLMLTASAVEGTDPLLRRLGIAAVVVLPAGMAALRFPNMQFPRYFLVPGLVLLLIEAEVVGRLWDRGSKSGRVVAASMLFATTISQAAADVSAIAAGRGASGAAVSLMAREGRPAYSSDNRFRSETVAEVAARRLHIALTYVPGDSFCTELPDWYIITDPGSAAPSSVTVGPGRCAAIFDKRATFPTAALSGMRWILYRRST